MSNRTRHKCNEALSKQEMEIASVSKFPIDKARIHLKNLNAEERLGWAYDQFKTSFALTTSFGIQSAGLLHMTRTFKSKSKPKVIWVDTGYLPPETYLYAEELTNIF